MNTYTINFSDRVNGETVLMLTIEAISKDLAIREAYYRAPRTAAACNVKALVAS